MLGILLGVLDLPWRRERDYAVGADVSFLRQAEQRA